LSDLKVLLTQTFDDGKYGPDRRNPGKVVKLPAKREKVSTVSSPITMFGEFSMPYPASRITSRGQSGSWPSWG
jgi:hypothetical protein